jgi:hypothetical protein
MQNQPPVTLSNLSLNGITLGRANNNWSPFVPPNSYAINDEGDVTHLSITLENQELIELDTFLLANPKCTNVFLKNLEIKGINWYACLAKGMNLQIENCEIIEPKTDLKINVEKALFQVS